jgi:hypothetical protein
MKKYLDIRHFIILILLLICLVEFINPKGIMPGRTQIVQKIDSIPYAVTDTLTVDSLVEVQVPYEVRVPYEVKVEVPTIREVDSLMIAKIFNETKQTKKDILVLPDNIGTVTVYDTIANNRIQSRTFTSKLKQKVVRDTIYTPIPRKDELYFGINAGLNKTDVIPNISAGLLFKTKSDHIYTLGLGVYNRVSSDNTNGTFDPYINGGVYWKIRGKKR